MNSIYLRHQIIFLFTTISMSIGNATPQGNWEGQVFDMGSNRVCDGGIQIKTIPGEIHICFKYNCQKAGGGKGVETWVAKNKKGQLVSKGKRIGFIKREKILLEETYPLNNDYQVEFKEDANKIDLLTDSAIGDYKGTLTKIKGKSVCL